MPEFPIFLADLVVPKPDVPESKPESGEAATPTDNAPSAPGVPVPPALIIVVAAFVLATIAAVVLISLKKRRGSPADSESTEPG